MRIDYSQIEPELTSRFRHLTRDLAQTSSAPNLRALVELRVSQINHCAYCIQPGRCNRSGDEGVKRCQKEVLTHVAQSP